jgi:hypothetical protein
MNAIGKTIRLYWRIQVYARLLPYVLAVLIVVTNTACAVAGNMPPPGVVYAIQPGSTVQGIYEAILGSPGTVILSNGKAALIGWPMDGGGYGIACMTIDCNSLEGLLTWLGGKGQLINTLNFSQIVKTLTDNGWTVIGGSLAGFSPGNAIIEIIVQPAGFPIPPGAVGMDG